MMKPILRLTARAVLFLVICFTTTSFAQILSVNPAALNFGNVSLNTAADLILNISNNGVLDLNIANMTLSNSSFSLIGGNAHIISPNTSKLIAVRFMPLVLGAQTDTLKIFSNDTTNNPAKFPLSGDGVSQLAPEISAQPLEVKFDSVLATVSKNLPLRVYNRGAANLNITNITSNNNRFGILSAKNFNLAPGDSSEVTIKFGPLDIGVQTGTLNITSNDANESPLAIKLIGIGQAIPAPTLTKIFPALGNRLQTLDVGFKGANFIAGLITINTGANVTVNSITVQRPDSLTANITIAATAATGDRNFFVTNPAPGGGTSAAQTFAVNNPSPSLASVTPAKGERMQALNVVFKGTNFINGVSTVNAGEGITVNSINVNNSTTLTAHLSVAATAATGPRDFSVTNAAPGGGASGVQSFAVNNPAPTLLQIIPNNGELLQTLDVGFKGTNFISGASSVNVGANIKVNSVIVQRPDSLTANMTIAANAATGQRNFSVTNSGPAGGVSGNQSFMIGKPLPALTAISPTSGNRLQTLNVGFKGANFIDGVTSINAGPNIMINKITVHRSDSLTANITIEVTAATGPRNFSVANNGAGASGDQVFTINNPAPILSSRKPTGGLIFQTLNVDCKGANFIDGVTFVNLGPGITVNQVTVHHRDSLTANVTITDSAARGPRNLAIVNAAPGGGTSATLIFTVIAPSPALALINPALGNCLQTLEVGFKGTNFIPNVSTVNAGPNITVNHVIVHRTDSLTANLTISANADLGSRNFSVSNGGAASEGREFTIKNPAPTLTRIAPASAFRGRNVDVVFTGTNFISKNTVVSAGLGIMANSVIVNSATSLTANLTILPNAARGPRHFSVINISPGGGISGDRTFVVANNDPSKPRLLSPANNQLIQLSRQTPALQFLWSKSFDADLEDTLRYAVNLKGPGLDTTFAAVKDTSVVLNILPRLKVNSEYSWSLRVSDDWITVSWPDRAMFRTSGTITAVQERGGLAPSEYHLEQNYPNPFKSAEKFAETRIKYQLPKESAVTLTIYDMLGREVTSLVNTQQPAGYYNVSWNGENRAGELAPAGIYICRLQAGSFERVMKMMIVR